MHCYSVQDGHFVAAAVVVFVAVEHFDFVVAAVVADFAVVGYFVDAAVDPSAGCVALELFVAHHIVASFVADVVEWESRLAVDIDRLDTVDLAVARDIAAEAAARDIVEQRLDDNFGEFHLDVELDNDPVKIRNIVKQIWRGENTSAISNLCGSFRRIQ